MSQIRKIVIFLFRLRRNGGRWVYVLWLVVYCTLTFVATAYAAVLGQDFVSAFWFFLVVALVGYAQVRLPTVFDWLLLFLPTMVFGIFVTALSPSVITEAVLRGDLARVGQSGLLLISLVAILWGFIHNMMHYIAEHQALQATAAPQGS